MRWIGLDCHLEFIEVAIVDAAGALVSAGRIESSEQEIRLFAEGLAPDDRVALESSANAAAIAALIRPHVAKVVIANSRRLAQIAQARAKTDRLDARTLAKLLRAGALEEVWMPDERTRARRRLCSRRAALVRARTRAKNEAHAVMARNLKGRPPATDVFGRAGRRWLAALELPADERLTLDACLRQVDFLSAEIAELERLASTDLLGDEDARRLMTIPGVGPQATLALLAAIGEISRFGSARQLVAYLGLDPRVRQSGSGEARHGRISKQGPAQARAALVEASQQAMRQPGPLRAFGARVRARRGHQVAAVAVARKLACLAWQLLTKGEDYAFERPQLTQRKLRRLELAAGERPRRGRARGVPSRDPGREVAERAAAERAEAAYRRLVADWKASGAAGAREGADAPRGRASRGPSTEPATRQASAPEPAL
jgi:transposase